MDGAVLLGSRVTEFMNGTGIGYVHGSVVDLNLFGQRLRQLVEVFLAEVTKGEGRTFFGESAGDCFADTSAGTSDNDH